MSNLPLVGQLPVQLNFVDVTTMTNVQISKSRTNTIKVGHKGPIGTARGVPKIQGTFDLAVAMAGSEFDLEVLWNTPGGSTITYQEGIDRYMLIGVEVEKEDLSNTPESGDTKKSVSFTATERRRMN